MLSSGSPFHSSASTVGRKSATVSAVAVPIGGSPGGGAARMKRGDDVSKDDAVDDVLDLDEASGMIGDDLMIDG